MVVLVFGNPDSKLDDRVFEVIKKFQNINFEIININGDLPVSKNLIILDTVVNIKNITVFTEKDLNRLTLSPRTTAHDYDLGFQLHYLYKIGKLKKITIIGIPQTGSINYSSLQSIFKKLVAHDIHGS